MRGTGPEPAIAAPAAAHRRRRWRLILRASVVLLGVYLLVAYLVLPAIWSRYEQRHPALADAETITHTGSGIPGDPINIGLIGSRANLHRAMLAARWYPADAITLASSIRIVGDVVLHRPYDDAPVSNLYLFGRKEDLAFEFPVGDDPDKRHHVRFWRSQKLDAQGRPLWFGAATMDSGVGLSHDTGQVTHHISADVDAERDKIIADLNATHSLEKVYWIDHFQKVLEGRNGGGDPWHTDGRLAVGVLVHQHESR